MRGALAVAGLAVAAVVSSACGQAPGVHSAATALDDTPPAISEAQAAALNSGLNRQLATYVVRVTIPARASRIRVTGVGLGSARSYLALYQRAALTCPGLPWTVLAAIGTVESENGQSNAPGVHSGANFKGAMGPMQFLPATFAQYALPVPPGGVNPPSPYDPVDAVYAAARDLCANGARDHVNLPAAVFAYNHADWYVTNVLTLAARFAGSL